MSLTAIARHRRASNSRMRSSVCGPIPSAIPDMPSATPTSSHSAWTAEQVDAVSDARAHHARGDELVLTLAVDAQVLEQRASVVARRTGWEGQLGRRTRQAPRRPRVADRADERVVADRAEPAGLDHVVLH